jgi:sterol desaturase/sphingolipid hydroxylase (fatty acid hydroxylase superfamily)
MPEISKIMVQIIETLGGPNGIWYLAAGFLLMVLLERLYYALTKPGAYDDADGACNIALNFGNSILKMGLAVLIPFTAYIWAYQNVRITTIDSLWIAIPLAFIVHELAYYWEHRASHRIGILWAFHAIHHSSNHFTHAVAARGFLLDGMVRIPLILPAAILGVDPAVFIAVEIIKNLFGIWNHAGYLGKLGWMDRVFCTPSNHRVHHGTAPEYIDRNYGQVLILWDRLFGSFTPEGDEKATVGLVKAVQDNNPLTAQFAGINQLRDRMRTAVRWQDKLAYLLRPPEWSHDGVCRSDCPKYAGDMLRLGAM